MGRWVASSTHLLIYSITCVVLNTSSIDTIPAFTLSIPSNLRGIIPVFSAASCNFLRPACSLIISSANEDLSLAIQERKFRKDLFFRLNTTVVNIPPLRERKEDLPVLIKYFIQKLGYKFNENLKESRKVLEVFLSYNWPGNVRELENVIENIIILSPSNNITFDLLPGKIKYYKQVGLYVFKRETLLSFSKLKTTRLEIVEGIELLRALDYSIPLRGIYTNRATCDVNIPEDIVSAENYVQEFKIR